LYANRRRFVYNVYGFHRRRAVPQDINDP
jgi:hypothetical protein